MQPFQITFTVTIVTLCLLHASFFNNNNLLKDPTISNGPSNDTTRCMFQNNKVTPNIIVFWLRQIGLDYGDPSLTISTISCDVLLSETGTISVHSSLKLQPMRPKFNTKTNLSYLMVLLLLAGDTELNPGPRPVKYPCLVCQKPAKWGQDCLQCDQFYGWYHIDCMDAISYLRRPCP